MGTRFQTSAGVESQTTLVRLNGVSFLTAMVGDLIRLIDSDRTEHLRTVLSATPDQIEFNVVPGLNLASFIIGSGRFRTKFAPTAKALPTTRKSLEGLTLRAIPGDRGSKDPILLSLFENFNPTAIASQEMEAFLDNAAGKTTEDRVTSLQAQGTDLEVEISSLSTENDFDVEQLEVIIREDGDEFVDQDVS